jgi:hypothetical protein
MRTRFLLLSASLALFPALAVAASPEDWRLVGDAAHIMERDTVVTYHGRPSGRLMSFRRTDGTGTMMQDIAPDDYLGKRVRFSGYVRARGVKNWAGLWMRVDSQTNPRGCGEMLAFDNMEDRPIMGSSEWTRYDVVLDVAKEAKGIAFGILLKGEGTVWLSGASFEVVGTEVASTNTWGRESKPANPNFDH